MRISVPKVMNNLNQTLARDLKEKECEKFVWTKCVKHIFKEQAKS